MIIYSCACGDQLTMTDNTEQSRVKKKLWKREHSAPLVPRERAGKVPDRGRAGIHGYIRRVVKSH